MLDVLTSTRYVLNQAENVKISAKAIDFFVSGVNKDDLPTGDVLLTKKRWPLESLIQIIFVFNTINFCFWAGRREKKTPNLPKNMDGYSSSPPIPYPPLRNGTDGKGRITAAFRFVPRRISRHAPPAGRGRRR